MPVETGDYLDDLVITEPLDSEAKKFGAGYLRFIKKVLKQTFPNVSGAITATHTTLNDFFGPVFVSTGALNTKKGAAVASATTTDIWTPADGNWLHITGTTTITSLGTAPTAGAMRYITFDGILTLTNGANLVLPDGINILTAAGDIALIVADTTTKMIVLSYTKAGVTSDAPVGSVQYWPTDSLPAGYLLCDGSAISRTTYARLFNVLVTLPNYTGQTFTVTIATPGVVTKTSHGFTGGERLRLTTTGALPTGLTAGNEYFVIYVDANTFRLATSETNYVAGTAINTSGSQSGTHTYTRSLYGLGDGSTTFNLPDLRDVFPRGKATTGRAIGSYQLDAMRQYTITGQVITEAALTGHSGALTDGGSSGDGGFNGAGIGPNVLNFSANNASYTVTAAENRPINRALLPIIKYI